MLSVCSATNKHNLHMRCQTQACEHPRRHLFILSPLCASQKRASTGLVAATLFAQARANWTDRIVPAPSQIIEQDKFCIQYAGGFPREEASVRTAAEHSSELELPTSGPSSCAETRVMAMCWARPNVQPPPTCTLERVAACAQDPQQNTKHLLTIIVRP